MANICLDPTDLEIFKGARVIVLSSKRGEKCVDLRDTVVSALHGMSRIPCVFSIMLGAAVDIL